MSDKKPAKPPKPDKKKPDKKAAKEAAPETDGEGAAAEGEGEGDGEAPAKKKLAGKTLILFIVLPALLLLGAGGGAAFFLLKPGAEQHAEADDHAKGKAKKKAHGKEKAGGHGGGAADANAPVVTEGDGVYYVKLPQMLINFSTDDGRPAFLKLKVTLEAPDEDVAYAVEPELPKIMDQFLGFLRELRMDDISGSAGTARLRLELLRRVNLAIAPAQMNAVLIEEMLVQ